MITWVKWAWIAKYKAISRHVIVWTVKKRSAVLIWSNQNTRSLMALQIQIVCFIWFSGRLHEWSEMKRDVQGKHRCILHISVLLSAFLKLKHTHKQIWIYAWFFTCSHNGNSKFYALNIAKSGIFFRLLPSNIAMPSHFCIITPERLTTLHFFYLAAFYEMICTVYCTSCCCFALEHPLVMIKDYNYLLFYLFGASKAHPRTN